MTLSKPLVFAALAAMAMPMAAHAGNDTSSQAQWSRAGAHDSGDHHFRLKVALWGDQFYADDPAVRAAMETQTINSMNDHDLDFTIFVGDTKNGHSLCTDDAIGQSVVDRFNRLDAPTMYSIGDNEWTDCHRANNGAYDPLERLAYIRNVFYNKDTLQGNDPIKVERQGQLGGAYSENSRFVKDDVEFVALDIIGSNNNLVATQKECLKKTGRPGRVWDSVNNVPLDECAAATAEYKARNAANLEWLKSSFAKARANHSAGILIAIQADMFDGIDVSDGNYADTFLPTLDPKVNGFADFFHALIAETQSFDGQVLLVHGDSHYFRVDKPMVIVDPTSAKDGQTQMNFTRVEVFGASDNSWVEMTVDPSTKNVFSFKQVDLQ